MNVISLLHFNNLCEVKQHRLKRQRIMKSMQLLFFLTLSLFSSISRVTYSFNTQARLSEFDIDEEEEDPIEKMLREIADEEKNFTKPRKKTKETSLPFPKSDVVFDKTDLRKGII